MDSDQSDDQFGRGQNPGEDVLDLGDNQNFDSEEEEDDDDEMHEQHPPLSQQTKPQAAAKPAAKNEGLASAQAVDNQHHDLAVSVNDSEEIDSEEEDDVHAMQQQQQMQPAQKTAN